MSAERDDSLPTVSIVIVTFNRRDEIALCLESIERQTFPNLETVVVDNGSSDGTVELIRERFPWVRLFAARENLGTSVSRNLAVRHATGELIWFLDSDTMLLDTEYVCRAAKWFSEDPGLGVLGGEAVADEQGRVVGVKRLMYEPNGTTYGEYLLDLEASERAEADCAPTCNFMTRKAIFRRVGGFDPWYFFYLEDLDLSWRISAAGYRTQVVGRVPVMHRFSPSSRKRDVWGPRLNRTFFALKNLPLWKLALLPLLDLGFFVSARSFGRLFTHARKMDLGAGGFVRQVETRSKPPMGRLLRAAFQAFEVVYTTYGCYFLVIPHVATAVRHRLRPEDYVGNTDLALAPEVSAVPAETGISSPERRVERGQERDGDRLVAGSAVTD